MVARSARRGTQGSTSFSSEIGGDKGNVSCGIRRDYKTGRTDEEYDRE